MVGFIHHKPLFVMNKLFPFRALMKQRFNFLDIRATVNEIKERLVGKFIQNYYTTGQRIIYIKFSNKDILLIEPGIRMHLTTNADTGISHFCNILRKKTRREKVVKISQCGFDRVVICELMKHKIVVEFFSGGNIFILEGDTVVEVFRVVKELDIIKNSIYVYNPVDFKFAFDDFIENTFDNFLPFDKALVDDLINKINIKTGKDILKLREEIIEKHNSQSNDNDLNLDALSFSKYSKYVEKKDLIVFNEEMIIFKEFIENIGGFGGIICKKKKYESFVPYDIGVTDKFESFNLAVDEFFKDRKKEKKVEDKSSKIKNKQLQYVQELEKSAEDLSHKADIIQENKELVQQIIDIHLSVTKNKIKWEDFKKFKDFEDKKGNEASLAIVSSDFKQNTAIIKLGDEFIELDFSLTLFGNVDRYYEKRKKVLDKAKKTLVAMDTIKIKSKIKEEKKKLTRPVFWFEKFNFFFSTDKKLIIGGKNAQQNEIIVKKHLNDKDLYFHTQASGGSSVVLKEPSDISIEEAGLMALCMSKCWETNVVSPVWYVKGEQVTKTAPTGQFLTKGSFLIKDNKTNVNVYKLEYGLGLLFKLVDTYECTDEINDLIQYDGARFVIDPKEHEIEFCLPVCGPWKVLKNYTYRVRIVPGKEKKGKMVNSIIKSFVDQSKEEHIRLIKDITVEEFINGLPTNSKIGKTTK
ncbi:Serologically defined colon cancer antigen 1 [Nosema bombycis CQ1]|uniref:Serologically defined colon cancer antigen 1 n=1 Tax=Nosema bombycis (strain CQ1 / CVCC 102059) TaxID=578461 RepID=R0KSI9_NOSB1|nr:Serologically defined colon cancer antigen 1 [Nosema bombycis CQ1]|eukprot:EOB13182.1 Serologically defined colon cancer antigen 1 [Nosema bombycis CQ1]